MLSCQLYKQYVLWDHPQKVNWCIFMSNTLYCKMKTERKLMSLCLTQLFFNWMILSFDPPQTLVLPGRLFFSKSFCTKYMPFLRDLDTVLKCLILPHSYISQLFQKWLRVFVDIGIVPNVWRILASLRDILLPCAIWRYSTITKLSLKVNSWPRSCNSKDESISLQKSALSLVTSWYMAKENRYQTWWELLHQHIVSTSCGTEWV